MPKDYSDPQSFNSGGLFGKVFQNRNLTCLWLGQIASQSGDAVFQIGLMWLVLELSGSETITGLTAMASYLPAVLIGLYAGVAADRGSRRRIMLTADGFRTFIVLLIPLAAYLNILTPAFLALNAFALAVSAAFFNPARDSLIPHIVPQSGLLRANSLIQTSWQFSLLLGPAAAGLLLHLLGGVHLFTADSAAYFISFLFILFIKPRRMAEIPRKRGIGLNEIKEGLDFVLRNKVILPLLLITIADNIFIMGPAIVGTPVFVKSILHKGAQEYALIQACYAVGMLAGTAALLTFGGRFKKGRILLFGMFLDGITFIPLFFVRSLILTELTIVIHSIAIPFLTISRASLIQEIVPGNLTGRVFALVNLSVVGMTAVSSGLAGIALEHFGAPAVFLVIGIGGGLCGVIGWLTADDLKNA
ncbi:MFS transporter [bacterium]|nr:MFS transporter [FCB group bacterium]MBL7190720.1 MFS transporter [bacterium]